MLDNPSKVLTFWNDYLKEENYYLTFFEEVDKQYSLFKNEEALAIDENREIFFEDITKLITNFKEKLDIVGYLEKKGDIDVNKNATEISYAYIIQFILYKNLVDNCYVKFNEEFKLRIVAIHNSLKIKSYQIVIAQIYGISNFISENLYKPFSKEQEYINTKIQIALKDSQVDFGLVTLWLDIIVFIKKYNFGEMQKEIFGYIYENYLKELYQETNKGQYFTDPAVVEFMLDEIGFTEKLIKNLYKKKQLGNLSLIDPACGSGTFLYSAVNRIVSALYDGNENRAKEIEELINNNIFGLDIAEFPLYLAEMNILMRMLPIIIDEEYNNAIDKKIKIFKTQDSVSEFMDAGITASIDKTIDDKGQLFIKFDNSNLNLQYESFIRDEDDLREMKQSMRVPRKRFDFVVGNPPYIGYNECCKQEVLFTQLIRDKKASMASIYGVNLNTVPNRVKKYSPKPNLFSFFIALGGGLLKSNGKMCYIIPQTILTSNDLDVLRYYLAMHTTIEKIITFEGKMFIGRGLKGNKPIATSSLIFIIKKEVAPENHKVNIINYINHNEVNFDKYLRSNKKELKIVTQNEFVNRIDNWNFIKFDNDYNEFINQYNNSLTVEDYRKSLNNYDLIMFDKGLVFKKTDIVNQQSDFQLVESSNNYTPDLLHQYISLANLVYPSGSQGIDVYRKIYKIIWSFTNPRYYFTDKDIMIGSNWAIMSSDDKKELLFLFSLLNSWINRIVLTNFAKTAGEKTLIISTKSIKQFFKIPYIDKHNIKIKEEIIKQTQTLLNLENIRLTDLVDFTHTNMQLFDNYTIKNNHLILHKDNNNYRLSILNIAKAKCINEILDLTFIEGKEIRLSTLKNLLIIDKKEQCLIKDYIDDLIFSLYFHIPINKIKITEAETIKNNCNKSEFYKFRS